MTPGIPYTSTSVHEGFVSTVAGTRTLNYFCSTYYVLLRMSVESDCSLMCCRYVLDGWPMTKAQMELLTRYKIIPVCIVELQTTNDEMLQRAEKDRQKADR